MDTLTLSRWQFGVTTVYHFFFVPFTIGMAWLMVYMETRYVKTKDPAYKKMLLFWSKLFLINFAIGVATGIVQEFQFGMNWSEYSRFVGDIFGAPLAMEALLAFFLESTFLGAWIFGWDKMSPKVHAFCMWMVAIGATISAFWILVASSFMHHPVGFVMNNGRAEMNDFLALITNPHMFHQFPHVILASLTTASFVVIGISAWQIYLKKKDIPFLHKSLKIGAWAGLVSSLLVAMVGHAQAQAMFEMQPMKMAAAEALYETEAPASLSMFSIVDEEKGEEVFSIRIPYLGSILLDNSLTSEMRGINDIQKEYEEKFGPGDYAPPVNVSFWSFRAMVGAGTVMILLSMILVFFLWKKIEIKPWMAKVLLGAITLPYVANTGGWLLTEIGRQPWVVQDLMQTKDAVSPSVTPTEAFLSLMMFTLLYGAFCAMTIFLFKKYGDKTEIDENSAGVY